jgi:Domain of unknown function (DUF2017)
MPDVTTGSSGTVVIRLRRNEADVLRGLADEMRTLLEADIPRADAVVSRLFPDAYEQRKQSEAFRDLVGDELRAGKLAALRDVTDKLGAGGAATLTLGEQEVDSWLTMLTDMRLAIGTRLEVTEETMGEDLHDDDPDAPAKSVLHWLGWLQEMTLAELTKEGR